MRIATFSDVHGNLLALEAVLAEIAATSGVDGYWLLGDACSQGYDPAGSARRHSALPNLKAVRGNTDHHSTADTHVIDEDFVEWMRENTEQAQRNFVMICNFFWTRGAVTAAGRYDWPAQLPVEHSDEEVSRLLASAAADVVIVGHTHAPLDRTVGEVRVWNLGSVSNPVTEDERAMWTLLEADECGYRLERRFAAYDIAAMPARLSEVRLPADTHIRRMWDGHEQRRDMTVVPLFVP